MQQPNSTLAIFGRGLAAIALSTASAAWAQKAALVQDIDDNVRVPYQQFSVGYNCNFAGNCAALFPVVPPGHRVVVETLSCVALLTGGTLFLPIYLSGPANQVQIFVPPVPIGASRYTANLNTLVYFNSGEQPRIDAYSSGPYSNFSCTLTGRDVTLP